MTTTTARLKNPSLTHEDFVNAVDQAAALATDLAAHIAERDKAVEAVERAHNPEIERLKAEQARLLGIAERYALANRAQLFTGKAKSASTPLAVYGFRSSTQLAKTSDLDDEALARELQTRDVSGWSLKLSLDKALIRKLMADTKSALHQWFRLDTTDTFFVQPKTDRLETPKV